MGTSIVHSSDPEKKLIQAQHRLEEAQNRDRKAERNARRRRLIQEGAILEKAYPEAKESRSWTLYKKTREFFLRRLLEVEKYVQTCGPAELLEHPLIRHEELCQIRKIWLHEKHEFDDALPIIYEEVTGKVFVDHENKTNRYFKKREWDILTTVCEQLLFRLWRHIKKTCWKRNLKNYLIKSYRAFKPWLRKTV